MFDDYSPLASVCRDSTYEKHNLNNNRSRAVGGVCNDVAASLLTFICYKKRRY